MARGEVQRERFMQGRVDDAEGIGVSSALLVQSGSVIQKSQAAAAVRGTAVARGRVAVIVAADA
jgi:hypothetical protein